MMNRFHPIRTARIHLFILPSASLRVQHVEDVLTVHLQGVARTIHLDALRHFAYAAAVNKRSVAASTILGYIRAAVTFRSLRVSGGR